jgi:hypothetical protein
LSNHSQLFLEGTFILSGLRERTSGIKLAGKNERDKISGNGVGGKQRAENNWRKRTSGKELAGTNSRK